MEQKNSPVPRVVEADFAAAAGPGGELPPPTFPEVAFAGRSNVGKSTLMNALLQRKNLVRTSSTPGCTRSVNLFKARCSDGLELFLVDLPGFGYARRSKGERAGWGPLLEGYLQRRASLRAVVLLVDVRRGPEEEEIQLLDFLRAGSQADRPPLSIILVATKVDKLPLAQRKPAVQKASLPGMPALGFSGVTGDGIEPLWRKIRKAIGVEV
ncbi:MAG: ribosome biogenesis GTP-binding protein YihA/YsxC [Myxococcales bacterium]|nr:ribosome biogenesis GTP-binding protein YihA/YsxC [Polyangiaceae bacterium]MDW8252137.1 ribosome biogenesis GTP-binding protein YihA/YsxC [Myxococcales bacterium]